MCASLINDSKFNKLITNTEISFQKVLLKKCSDVFYTLTKHNSQELDKLKQIMQNKNMVNSYVIIYIYFYYDYYLLPLILYLYILFCSYMNKKIYKNYK